MIMMKYISSLEIYLEENISGNEEIDFWEVEEGIKGAAIKGVAWLVLAPWKESVLDIGR